jgi:hypothetical protein
MSDKEILTTISSQLKEISINIECLNQRIDKLEGKTNDMHQYIPFVGWLENVGASLSNSWLLKNVKKQPILREKGFLQEDVLLEEKVISQEK